MASNHTKTSFSSTNLHKNAGKMSFVRNKIEFCNKIRVSAFLVKIEFPLKRTKNKPEKGCWFYLQRHWTKSYHNIKLLTCNLCHRTPPKRSSTDPHVILIPYCVAFYTWLGFMIHAFPFGIWSQT